MDTDDTDDTDETDETDDPGERMGEAVDACQTAAELFGGTPGVYLSIALSAAGIPSSRTAIREFLRVATEELFED